MKIEKIFFNCSLPRSGSTLLQNILWQNPRFHCSPTNGLLDLLLAARQLFTEMAEFKAQDPEQMKAAFFSYCRAGLFGFYEGISQRPVCIDKSRGWLHYYQMLDGFYPKPKMLVCVRDLRAILSSMEKLYRANKHKSDREDLQAKMNMITIHNRVAHWLNSVPVGIALMRLIDGMETGTIKNCHVVRFEDLTSAPKATMQKIYAYLEEPWFEHDFENVEQVTREDDAQHGIYGEHNIRTKVRPLKPDYAEILGVEVSEQIKNDNAIFFEAFYPGVK